MINSCMFVLASFLNQHGMGMPNTNVGWMLNDKNYAYTWITDMRKNQTTWILIARSKKGTKFKNFKGYCKDGSAKLKVYELTKRD